MVNDIRVSKTTIMKDEHTSLSLSSSSSLPIVKMESAATCSGDTTAAMDIDDDDDDDDDDVDIKLNKKKEMNVKTTAIDDEDDHDPIVMRIPVYLSQTLADSLYLLMYPTRHGSLGRHDVRAARIKREQSRMEVEVAIDTSSQVYNEEHGVEIGKSAVLKSDVNSSDGTIKSVNAGFKSGKMDHIRLSSSVVASSSSPYAIGALVRNDVTHSLEMHMSPLRDVLQMRPLLEYLDLIDESNSRDNSATDAAANHGTDNTKKTPQPVQVRFAKRETSYAAAARKSSYAHHLEQVQSEPWTELAVSSADSETSMNYKKALLFNSESTERVLFDPSPSAYLRRFNPRYVSSNNKWISGARSCDMNSIGNNVNKEDAATSKTASVDIKSLSLNALRELPFAERVKAMLINAIVMPFDLICSLLKIPTTKEMLLLTVLQSYAVLVRGCWVVKSELLYPTGFESTFTRGVYSGQLIRGRDYILSEFCEKNKTLTRHSLSEHVCLPSDDLKEMLMGVAVTINRSWHFRYDDSVSFSSRFPKIVQEQNGEWATRRALLESQLKHIKPVNSIEKSLPSSSKKSSANLHVTNNKTNEDVLVATSKGHPLHCDGSTLQEQVSSLIAIVLASHSVASLRLFRHYRHRVAVGPITTASDAELVNALEIGAREIVKEDITDDGRIFCERKADTTCDPVRDVILDLFSKNARIKKADVTNTLKAKGIKIPTPQQYNKIMKEFGVVQGNVWTLKEGHDGII